MDEGSTRPILSNELDFSATAPSNPVCVCLEAEVEASTRRLAFVVSSGLLGVPDRRRTSGNGSLRSDRGALNDLKVTAKLLSKIERNKIEKRREKLWS